LIQPRSSKDMSRLSRLPSLLAQRQLEAEAWARAKELLKTEPREPLTRDFWLPELQVMGARSFEGSKPGLYVAAKGGHNAESHNHNDVGNFIVYADGYPALIDVGVETYTAKTFSLAYFAKSLMLSATWTANSRVGTKTKP